MKNLRSFLLILFISLLSSSAAFALPKVLIMAAEQDSWIADVQTKLVATGQFATVDRMVIPTAGGSIPTLSQLQAYNAVLVFGDYGMGSGEGSVLASYVDGGGAVVLANFCLSYTQLGASFNNSTYQVIVPSGGKTGTATLGSVLMPTHPIMNGISSINSGSSGYRGTSTSLAGSSYIIADWSDGTILVAAREGVGPKAVRRVDINMFPVSSTIRSDFWQASTDGALLMANALTWAAGGGTTPAQLSLEPHTLNYGAVPIGDTETICVTAKNVDTGAATMLHIKNFYISGVPDFTIVSGPSVGDSLALNQDTQFCIRYIPEGSGSRQATFTLVTDGKDSGTQTVDLNGLSKAPSVSYGVTSLFHQVHTMLGDTSAVEYVPVTSTGLVPLTFDSIYFIGLDASDYFLTRLPANPLAPDVTDSIGIRFVPKLEGRPDASLVVNTNAVNIPSDTIRLVAVGTLPHLVITVPPPGSGNTVMFDSVAIGDSVCQTLMLTNVGTDTLQILQQLVTYGDYDFTYHPLMGTDTSVPPGDTVYANVCFKPLKQGTRVATIRFFTNIPPTFTKPSLDTGEFDINVTGIGVPYGALALSGKVRDTAIVTETNCLSDTITNAGLNDVTVDSIGFAPDTASFTANIVAPFVLAAHSSLGVSLCFTAKMRGTEQDTLFLIGTSSEQPVIDTVVLYGVGVETCVAADSMITFGADSMTLVNSTDTTCLTVTNCGDLPAIYTASTPTGAGYTLLSPIMDTVAAGGATHFCVSFHPTAIGAVPGSILVTGGPNAVTTLLEGVGAGVVANGSGTLTTPVMEGKCDTFDITITNTGNAAWTPGTGTITGANAADFTITTQATPATIAPGGTATVTIDFCPTTSGTESMTLTFLQAAPVPVAGAFSYSTTAIGASAGVTMKSAQDGFVLGASYPNPTNEKAAIELTLPKDANVRIDLLNATGELVRTAFSGHLSSGTQTVTIDAKGLPSGTYFYMLTSGDVRLTRQLSLVK